MYFSDAYPELSAEQRRSFATEERRLLTRLVCMGCFGVILLCAVLV